MYSRKKWCLLGRKRRKILHYFASKLGLHFLGNSRTFLEGEGASGPNISKVLHELFKRWWGSIEHYLGGGPGANPPEALGYFPNQGLYHHRRMMVSPNRLIPHPPPPWGAGKFSPNFRIYLMSYSNMLKLVERMSLLKLFFKEGVRYVRMGLHLQNITWVEFWGELCSMDKDILS